LKLQNISRDSRTKDKTKNQGLIMDFSTALPTFVITLREGVEAALVVGIVLALLKKAKASHLNSWVYAGVGCGLVVSALLGAMFGVISKALDAAVDDSASTLYESAS
jgi:high-affinity iron transporter